MTTIDAPQPDSRSVIRSTAATSAFVVGWYALPDYVRSRPARVALKVAGLAAFTVLGIRDRRQQEAWKEASAALRGSGTPPWRRSAATEGFGAAPGSGGGAPVDGLTDGALVDERTAGPGEIDAPKIAAVAGAAVVVVGSTVLTVVVEKRVFRRNEERLARGVRRPHTRTGIVFGALTALVAVPDVLRSRAAESGTS